MKFINFIIVKLSGCLVAGIVVAQFIPSLFFFLILKIGLLCLLLLLIVWWADRSRLQPKAWFGILTYLIFFALGYTNYQLRKPSRQKAHYSHLISEDAPHMLQLKVREVLKPNRSRNKYMVEVHRLDSEQVAGKLLLTVPKDTTRSSYAVDDLLWLYAEIKELPSPLNPHQFNYKEYLHQLGVYHQLNIRHQDVLESRHGNRTLKGLSEKIRSHVIEKLDHTPIKSDQKAIIQALLLGQKKDITRELYHQYAAAGALHILAVSGLHVGILYLLFSRLMAPLDRLRLGKPIKSVLLVMLLWCFAMVAGLSPSVVRAVTMFSFFALAGLLNRTTNNFNTLFLSFFVLLLFQPGWLFHVGFQLSYLAVFFILWVQPGLYTWYRPRYYPDRMLWGIITVTLAAQLGVAPLSLYYFHQFPGLFFLTNLIVLPFITVLLAAGLIVVILAVCDLLPHAVAMGYNWLIAQLNDFVGWVASQDAFLWESVSFSFPLLLASYLVICTLILWGINRHKTRLLHLMAAITIGAGIVTLDHKIAEKEQLTLFHRTGASLLGYQKNRKFTLLQGGDEDYFDRFPIKDYRIGSYMLGFTAQELPDVFSYKDQRILRLDSLGVYPSEKIDVLLLTYSPKVHLERLIDSLEPALILADGSNYTSYVHRWRASCAKRKLPFYHTGESGAYIFD